LICPTSSASWSVPFLRRLVVNQTSNSVELSTGVVVETGVPNIAAFAQVDMRALIDEVAFLRSDESANPDFEIMHAIAHR